MRIGIIRFNLRIGGGAEHSLRLLAVGLAKRGHEVYILTNNWEGEWPFGVIVYLLFNKVDYTKARLKLFSNMVIKLVDKLKLDVSISLERIPDCQIFRAGDGCHLAWLERRAPYESILKRFSLKFNPIHYTYLAYERNTLLSPNLFKIVANSHLVANELQKYYSLNPNLITVIYNNIDNSRFNLAEKIKIRKYVRKSVGISDTQPILLFLGAGFERKGLAFIMQALVNLHDVILWVVGRDRIEPWRYLAQKFGVLHQVYFLGYRPDAIELLSASDVLILPTIYDPCANSCLEALNIGIPIVTTLANGASALIEDNVNGILISEPADYSFLSKACELALNLDRINPYKSNEQESWVIRMEKILYSIVKKY